MNDFLKNIYHTFDEFYENYLTDLEEQTEYKPLKYLKNLKKKYDFVYTELSKESDAHWEIKRRDDQWLKTAGEITFLLTENTKIVEFINSEIKIKEAVIEGIAIKRESALSEPPRQEYSKRIIDLANAAFAGDMGKLDLLRHFVENFSIDPTPRSNTDLNKYNQIYSYLNSLLYPNKPREGEKPQRIIKSTYKDLIKELYGFDYAGRDINSHPTPRYEEQLENLFTTFNEYYQKKRIF